MNSTLSDRVKLALAGPPKVSQVALARACGVRAPSVNDWVSGKTKTIEGANLLNAAAFLKVSPKWLAEGIGPMRPDDKGAQRPVVSEPASQEASLSPEALQLALEFDLLDPNQKRTLHAMLTTYIRESSAAQKPFQYNKKTNVAPFSPASGRGISGDVQMIGNVSPPKGARHGQGNKHPRVPSKKHSGES